MKILPPAVTTIWVIALLLAAATLAATAAAATAEKPAAGMTPARAPEPCNLGVVTYDWDFATGPHGFYLVDCDQSGLQVWEHGPTTYIPGAPARVWGTILEGDYPPGSGSGLVSPPFFVESQSVLVQVYHYFDTELGYDGGNVSVGVWPQSVVIPPIGGYFGSVSTDPDYYSFCVDEEEGWSGTSNGWRVDCFDLSAFVGQTVTLEFDFGSDESMSAAGWYIARVVVGGPIPETRACCIPETGWCRLLSEFGCAQAGGVWNPALTSCEPNPCPQPLYPAALRVCPRSNPEPWRNYVPLLPGGRIPLRLDLPPTTFPPQGIVAVEFFYSHDQGASWEFIGADEDGSEPRLSTIGPPTTIYGNGWNIDCPVPEQLPDEGAPALFKAVVHREGQPAREFTTEITLDPAPPDLATTNIEDFMPVPNETLELIIEDNGILIDSVIVWVAAKPDTLVKGVPGISQQPHSPTHCAPTAAAQCLKYFEQVGDSTITGELSEFALVESLAAQMATNQVELGTRISDWKAGLVQWITDHGNGYTVSMDRHYLADGTPTWTPQAWQKMRNELERGQDVLVGVFWPLGDGHALTLNSIINTPLANGRVRLDFMDPWTGLTENGELDTQTGWIYNLTGAGGGGSGYVGVTIFVCPVELSLRAILLEEIAYTGPVPPGQNAIPITIPDITGHAFVHVAVVNTSGHAALLTGIVTTGASAAPGGDHTTDAFFLDPARPSAFRERTALTYGTAQAGPVLLAVYDVSGRLVRTLVRGSLGPGRHEATWDGRDDRAQPATSGVYFVRLTAAGREVTRKVLLLR